MCPRRVYGIRTPSCKGNWAKGVDNWKWVAICDKGIRKPWGIKIRHFHNHFPTELVHKSLGLVDISTDNGHFRGRGGDEVDEGKHMRMRRLSFENKIHMSMTSWGGYPDNLPTRFTQFSEDLVTYPP